MRTSLLTPALLFALLATPMALTGCETETQTEIESDGDVDTDTELSLDTDGIEAAMDSTGEAIENAADEAEDVIDENIDLGDNAESQDG